MKNVLVKTFHVALVVAKLPGPGSVRAVVAENLLLKRRLVVLRRPRRRTPNPSVLDRFLFGFGSLLRAKWLDLGLLEAWIWAGFGR